MVKGPKYMPNYITKRVPHHLTGPILHTTLDPCNPPWLSQQGGPLFLFLGALIAVGILLGLPVLCGSTRCPIEHFHGHW